MVLLPPPKNRVAEAIFEVYKGRHAEEPVRGYLGASMVGDENCLRHLWYSFRWAMGDQFEGRLLRLFARGHREEAWLIEDLRAAGMTVVDLDESKPIGPDGKHPQFRFEAVDGHFGGGCDGKVLGIPGAAKTWHLLECKGINKKWFNDLCKKKVRKAQPTHFAQMQIYMKGFELTRALYLVVCKDDDRIYVERLHFDEAYADAILAKARTVIEAPRPLSKINEDPAWHECKFCDHRPVCHVDHFHLLQRNCRTCASSTAMSDGKWRCDFHERPLSVEEQLAGCKDHVFVPGLIPYEIVGASDVARVVYYKKPEGGFIVDYEQQLTHSEKIQ